MNAPSAVVIGAGVGGLTAAVALGRRGWQVTVLEKAASLEPVGAGIALAPNAQRCLDTVGLGDRVRALAAWQGAGGLRTPRGRWLSRLDAADAERRFGGAVVLLHRAALVGLLAGELPPDALRTGVAAEVADPGTAGRPARVRAGTREYEADLVVGADGIDSGVRRVLFPAHPGPAYSGFTAWRAVVEVPGLDFAPHETWGRGALWGSQPLKDGRVYVYGSAVAPRHGHAPDDEKSELLRRFGDWHDPVPRLIAATEPAGILRNDISWLEEPLPAFHHGRTALIGDAAHAMTPHLAQGGNQAIEDAVVLAHHVRPAGDPAASLERYTRDRLPRTTEVVRRSRRAGRVTMLRNPVATALRDTAARAASTVAPRAALKALDGIADWSPPAGQDE
ncbi:Aurachin C monooxygenase/isomerase [Streptomyces sp. RB5]|uniref:Aurachin C monooxygenase/isomerase n=1 Tax=Streptomyces smaragdinus TaxID=2585196 RepID=A0A7K0CC95_9ACTN|nr:FAD-dependent monooxygenase [Streptomyces smaragdinus]MQY10384.1 Aurachin C monooxygenase/isomerase [Streptomyces smaragdinus]